MAGFVGLKTIFNTIENIVSKIGTPKQGQSDNLFDAISNISGGGGGSIPESQMSLIAKQGNNTSINLTSVDGKLGSFESGKTTATELASISTEISKLEQMLTLADGEVTNELNSL